MSDETYRRTAAGLRQVLDPGLTFETFVVGRSNERAHAVAVAVARERMSTVIDLVILDDVDFLAGRDRTVEELCLVIEAMAASGKQLVLCSSEPPRTIGELESRFGRGSFVEVHPLDVPHMLRVLERKARASGLDLQPDVARHIAGHVGNVRELEGVLTRLSALRAYYRRPIDMGFLDERMADLVSPPAAPE